MFLRPVWPPFFRKGINRHSRYSNYTDQRLKPRPYVLIDIGNEPANSGSLVRLMLFSNDIRIEGLVASTSRHHPAEPRPDLINRRLDAYGKVLSNLRENGSLYPAADELRDKVFAGSSVYGMTGVGPWEGNNVRKPRLLSKLDWEAELGIVIGMRLRNVNKENVLDYVAGAVAGHVARRERAAYANG